MRKGRLGVDSIHSFALTMVSLARTLRNIRRVGLREWYRQMWYIGDAKAGTFVGRDECARRL